MSLRAIAAFLLLFLVSAAAQAQKEAKPELSMTVTGQAACNGDWGDLGKYR